MLVSNVNNNHTSVNINHQYIVHPEYYMQNKLCHHMGPDHSPLLAVHGEGDVSVLKLYIDLLWNHLVKPLHCFHLYILIFYRIFTIYKRKQRRIQSHTHFGNLFLIAHTTVGKRHLLRMCEYRSCALLSPVAGVLVSAGDPSF